MNKKTRNKAKKIENFQIEDLSLFDSDFKLKNEKKEMNDIDLKEISTAKEKMKEDPYVNNQVVYDNLQLQNKKVNAISSKTYFGNNE